MVDQSVRTLISRSIISKAQQYGCKDAQSMKEHNMKEDHMARLQTDAVWLARLHTYHTGLKGVAKIADKFVENQRQAREQILAPVYAAVHQIEQSRESTTSDAAFWLTNQQIDVALQNYLLRSQLTFSDGMVFVPDESFCVQRVSLLERSAMTGFAAMQVSTFENATAQLFKEMVCDQGLETALNAELKDLAQKSFDSAEEQFISVVRTVMSSAREDGSFTTRHVFVQSLYETARSVSEHATNICTAFIKQKGCHKACQRAEEELQTAQKCHKEAALEVAQAMDAAMTFVQNPKQ